MKKIKPEKHFDFNRATIVVLILFALVVMVLGPRKALAIAPPTPAPAVVAKVPYCWVPSVWRVDMTTALPASERKATRLYISSLPNLIEIAEPANCYTYVVPAGQCIHKTDVAYATTVDTAGLESGPSNAVSTDIDACSEKKLLPKAPTTSPVKVILGS